MFKFGDMQYYMMHYLFESDQYLTKHISHLVVHFFIFLIFGYAIYVPIAPPHNTKMRPQRRLEIYIGFDSSSIIRYLEPLTNDIFKAHFEKCHFDENIFPSQSRF